MSSTSPARSYLFGEHGASSSQKSPTHGDIKFTNQTGAQGDPVQATRFEVQEYSPRQDDDRDLPRRGLGQRAGGRPGRGLLRADPRGQYGWTNNEKDPYALTGVDRKAKKGNSKVASQLGIIGHLHGPRLPCRESRATSASLTGGRKQDSGCAEAHSEQRPRLAPKVSRRGSTSDRCTNRCWPES